MTDVRGVAVNQAHLAVVGEGVVLSGGFKPK